MLYIFMVTTIQVNDETLLILKKLKQMLQTASYDETIRKVAVKEITPKVSMRGSLKKYLKKGETVKDLLREMQEERRKSDRF